MNTKSRLAKAFKDAPVLPWTNTSRYVMISDCHRGCGNSNDNFLKNQNLYFSALNYYFREGYTYLELGDGDELWENRSMNQILEVHSNTFWLLSCFHQQHRLYMLYGNHDIAKRSSSYCNSKFTPYLCKNQETFISLLSDICFYEGLILKNKEGGPDLYVTHGHQGDTFNSTFWPLARFLVRYIWKPLENIGFLDPTSAAKNNMKKDRIEIKFTNWASEHQCLLMTGHTHRPALDIINKSPYLNTGSCVHPRCITAIELNGMEFTLVKWTIRTNENFALYVGREVLAGPFAFDSIK